MTKKIFFIAFFLTQSLFAIGPTIECRFAALDDDGVVALDELVAYTLNPVMGISGNFDPYGFDIAVFQGVLTIGVYLGQTPVSGLQIPVVSVINLPVGATVFGLNTIFHDRVADFVSLRYECRKVLYVEGEPEPEPSYTESK